MMPEKPSLVEQTAVVILAAGQGKRMGRTDMAKVCFEIDGIPAINRIINTFKSRRYRKFVVIIGSKAEHVMETVAPHHPETVFVYQTPQFGTGHAARVAAVNAVCKRRLHRETVKRHLELASQGRRQCEQFKAAAQSLR